MLDYRTVRTRRGNDVVVTTIGPDDGETGDGKAPVFLVHPINLRKECWLDVVRSLAGERRCVSVDLAGHGESSDDEEFTLAGWVSDCVDVVTALDVDRLHVVGGSLGGAIALCLAGELPAKAVSVTAMGSYLSIDDESAPNLAERLDANGVDDLFAALAVEAIAPGSPASLVSTVRYLTNSHGQPVVRCILRAAHDADATPWVARVSCPVLVLTGEFDTSCTPEAGMRMAASVGGRCQQLHGVGHLPMLEDATGVLAIVVPHLDAAESRAWAQ